MRTLCLFQLSNIPRLKMKLIYPMSIICQPAMQANVTGRNLKQHPRKSPGEEYFWFADFEAQTTKNTYQISYLFYCSNENGSVESTFNQPSCAKQFLVHCSTTKPTSVVPQSSLQCIISFKTQHLQKGHSKMEKQKVQTECEIQHLYNSSERFTCANQLKAG